MAKYVLCPRCELNYMLDTEEYCDVCKAELKLGPQLIFALDEDAETGEKLCPVCKRNYISEDENMCEQCRDDNKYDTVPDDIDIDKDEEWRNYLDDDEKDMPQDDEISFSQLADEEKGDELFRDDDEEEDDMSESVDDEPDDFDIDIDEKDFEDDDEEDDDEDEDDDEEDDDF